MVDDTEDDNFSKKEGDIFLFTIFKI